MATKKSGKAKAKSGNAKAKSGKTKTAKAKKAAKAGTVVERAKILSSEVVFSGPIFRVCHDKVIDPDGTRNERDVIRHNGSAVILALDNSKSKKDPWVVMERQYRHAANQYLWEIPAGKLEAGEDALAGAQRELAEETGYRAKKWRPLVNYYASPGLLGESMQVFVAEGLRAGDTHWDEDERIELRLVKLSELLRMIEKGEIHDGKTLTGVLLYVHMKDRKRKK